MLGDDGFETARQKVAAALTLIANHDPRGYRRIQDGIKRVWVGGTHNRGEYFADLQMCMLNDAYVLSDDTSPGRLAQTFAHEAMHARLARLHLPYVQSARYRQERLCIQAEIDLAERMPDGLELAQQAEARQRLPAEVWSDAAIRERQLQAIRDLWPGRVGTFIARILAFFAKR
jgi:hypothetical protein